MYLKLKLLFCDTNFKIEKSTSSLRIRKVSHYTHTHTHPDAVHPFSERSFFFFATSSFYPTQPWFFFCQSSFFLPHSPIYPDPRDHKGILHVLGEKRQGCQNAEEWLNPFDGIWEGETLNWLVCCNKFIGTSTLREPLTPPSVVHFEVATLLSGKVTGIMACACPWCTYYVRRYVVGTTLVKRGDRYGRMPDQRREREPSQLSMDP